MELVDRKEVNELLHRQRDMQSRVNQLPTYDACYLGSPCEYQNEDIIIPRWRERLSEMRSNGKKDGMEWIPVTERLPEKDGDYLVTSYTYDKSKVYVATRFFVDGEWLFCGKEIVAWMELPKPYKEGAEE